MMKLCIRGFFLSAVLLWSCVLSAPPTDNDRIEISAFFIKVNATRYYGSIDDFIITIYIADDEHAHLNEVEIIYRDEVLFTRDFSDGESRSIPISEDGRQREYIIEIIPSPSLEDGFQLIFHAGQLTDTASEIRGGLNGKYRLMNPIVLTEAFVPIAPDTDSSMAGHQGTKFTGIFDGNDKSISNLKILVAQDGQDTPQDYVGFFTAIGGSGEVHSLTLVLGEEDEETPSIEGASYVGALAGVSEHTARIHDVRALGGFIKGVSNVGGLVGSNAGTITHSHAEGTVTGTGENVGGLVGFNASTVNPNIQESYATGDVTSEGDKVGGLVGNNNAGIERNYATGNVSGKGNVGGLLGYAGSSSSIKYSYAEGTVTGTGENVGGLVGLNESVVNSNDEKSIENSYATGEVSGTKYSGGLVGNNKGTVTESYATGAVAGEEYIGGLVGYNHSGEITQSYATGAVAGTSKYIGGLVGSNDHGTIVHSYATGAVEGTGANSSRIGGLVGSNANGSITDSYFDAITTGQGGAGTAYYTNLADSQVYEADGAGDLIAQDDFSGWSFDNLGADIWIWYWQGEGQWPILKFETE